MFYKESGSTVSYTDTTGTSGTTYIYTIRAYKGSVMGYYETKTRRYQEYIGGGKPKIYFLPLDRKLLSAFCYEGKDYEFNFSKFWTLTRTRFSCKETDTEIIWHVRQETTRALMDTKIRCSKKEMVLVNYEAPDGSKRHNRLWNGGNGKVEISAMYKGKWIRLSGNHVLDERIEALFIFLLVFLRALIHSAWKR